MLLTVMSYILPPLPSTDSGTAEIPEMPKAPLNSN